LFVQRRVVRCLFSLRKVLGSVAALTFVLGALSMSCIPLAFMFTLLQQ
jgi:hypothetical protein